VKDGKVVGSALIASLRRSEVLLGPAVGDLAVGYNTARRRLEPEPDESCAGEVREERVDACAPPIPATRRPCRSTS